MKKFILILAQVGAYFVKANNPKYSGLVDAIVHKADNDIKFKITKKF